MADDKGKRFPHASIPGHVRPARLYDDRKVLHTRHPVDQIIRGLPLEISERIKFDVQVLAALEGKKWRIGIGGSHLKGKDLILLDDIPTR